MPEMRYQCHISDEQASSPPSPLRPSSRALPLKSPPPIYIKMPGSTMFVVANVGTKRYAPKPLPTKKTRVTKLPGIPPPAPTKERPPVVRPAAARAPRAVPRKSSTAKPAAVPPPARDEAPKAEVPKFKPRPLILVERLNAGELMPGPTSPSKSAIPARPEPRRSFSSRIPRLSKSVSPGKSDTVAKNASTTSSRIPVRVCRRSAAASHTISRALPLTTNHDLTGRSLTSEGTAATGVKLQCEIPSLSSPPLSPSVSDVLSSPTSMTTASSPTPSVFSSRSTTSTPLFDVSNITTPTICNESLVGRESPGSPPALYARAAREACGVIRLKACPPRVLAGASVATSSSSSTPSPSAAAGSAQASLASVMLGCKGAYKLKSTAPRVELSNASLNITLPSPPLSVPSPSKPAGSAQANPASVAVDVKVTRESKARAPISEGPTSDSNSSSTTSPTLLPSFPPRTGLATHATNVAQVLNTRNPLRKFYIPPLAEGAQASQNPSTQMEIEALRAQKKVAGGGAVDPTLERLGSLAGIAVVRKLRARFEQGE
ncbi:hypothetical protein HYDPIDRAFT_31689 [Hydnomerulius pinastri MD-312]|uniref:Uncharacterized protein n=1 Tax=Hydnomerulius pinastri MD-312 TaxID=994086 RepID=A0A0C9V5W5_9AGAM|nr:hypothetical protein HYDPIDRAFT_31689 [Hydnomerulius pinastri MD-312]